MQEWNKKNVNINLIKLNELFNIKRFTLVSLSGYVKAVFVNA